MNAGHAAAPQTPAITLAGKAWPVPVLAPRQNRVVVPALLVLIPKIAEARANAGNAGGGGSLAQLASWLDTATFDLLCDAVHQALTRARPELSRAEFDALPIDTTELLAAMPTIAQQAGLLK